MIELTNRIALVTGASRGIGRAIVEALAKQGAYVIAASRGDNAAPTGEAGQGSGGRGDATSLDVTDPAAIERAVQDVVAKHGRIDVVVSNAGITRDGLLLRMKSDEWDAGIATTLK